MVVLTGIERSDGTSCSLMLAGHRYRATPSLLRRSGPDSGGIDTLSRPDTRRTPPYVPTVGLFDGRLDGRFRSRSAVVTPPFSPSSSFLLSMQVLCRPPSLKLSDTIVYEP